MPGLSRSRSIVLCVTLFVALLHTGPVAGEPAGDVSRWRAWARSAKIYRDRYGVPHVFARTDAAAVFGYVYAQAEDNFAQIEDTYARALGRSAEIYGEAALPGDLLVRALETAHHSRAEYARASPAIGALCDAAVGALNFYLADHPKVKPRVVRTFEPWQVFAVVRYGVYGLFAVRKAGLRTSEIAGAVSFPATRDPGSSRDGSSRDGFERGSNMWAVAPRRSASGHALLLVNPHQPFWGPGQFYEGHVQSDQGWNMSGASFFGGLMPTLGHNEHLGWSHTVNDPDVGDLYAEVFDRADDPLMYRYGGTHRSAVAWKESVSVKISGGVERRTVEFRKTHHGPIVAVRDGKPLALRLARYATGGQLQQWYAMSKATSLEEFKAALAVLAVPMFNIAYADRAGNIFYLYNAAIPRRDPQFDWTEPVDGSRPETEWQGFHSLDELPQVLNPKCGFVQNCNQSPFTTTGVDDPAKSAFPSYMTRDVHDNGRARISRRILERQSPFTFASWSEAAWDTTVIEAETTLPKLLRAAQVVGAKDEQLAAKLAEPIKVLSDWDGISHVDSVAMTLFALWFERLGGLDDPSDLTAAVEVFDRVLVELEEAFGTWRVSWGEVNRLQRIDTVAPNGQGAFDDDAPSLAVAGAPGPLGIVFNFYARPQRGQKRRYGLGGHSFVSVVEFGPRVRAASILVFGQSGAARSPHYFDQARLYAERKFKPAWFSREEVLANTVESYHPGAVSR